MDKFMPKKIKNCFYKNLTFEKLMAAHKRARKHKAYKDEIIEYEFNLENNITNLLNNIKSKKYRLGKYREFKVYEPKERVIKALPYPDRIVHQWYVEEFIKPYILPKFISTSFACIPERGTHRSAQQIEKYMRIFKRNYGDFWVLKCDISKFFYSINPRTLFNIMEKYISDKALLDFTKLLIFDRRESFGQVGIPIGNYTSQFFANIYLNKMDQYVKRVLKIKYYVRYMDDFILIHRNKKYLQYCLEKINKICNEELDLELNQKTQIGLAYNGIDFLGFNHILTNSGKVIRKLRFSSKQRMRNHIKIMCKLKNKSIVDEEYINMRVNAFKAHLKHSDEKSIDSLLSYLNKST